MKREIVFRASADASPKYCVTVGDATERNGRALPLRLDLASHSPSGFGFGYHGAGPAQLALAMLAEVTGDDRLALALHHDFKADVIARLPMDRDWLLSVARVRRWIEAQGVEVAA